MKRIITLVCGWGCVLVGNAGVFGPVEPGLEKDQVIQGLKNNRTVNASMNEAFIARTGLNGVYETKMPIGTERCELFFNFNGGTKLRSIDCYTKKSYPSDQFDSMLRSAYKNMVNDLVAQYGKPVNSPEWIKAETVSVNGMRYIHDIQVGNNMYISAGIAQRAPGQYLPIFTVSQTRRAKSSKAADPKAAQQDWKAVMEFPHIYQADELMKSADEALKSKKYDYALQIYKQAGKLGNGKAYWCASMLYSGNKIKGDREAIKKNAEEYNKLAAEYGCAPAAMKYGRTLPEAAKKLGWDEGMCKMWVSRTKRAAEAGHSSAQYSWGMMNKAGFGVPANPEEAKKYLKLAADQGDAQAKSALRS